ncbi:hypothetical protein ACHQM5_015703 [Ranunculus cassubicifolius]
MVSAITGTTSTTHRPSTPKRSSSPSLRQQQQHTNHSRSPLLPSESDNGVAAAVVSKKPKSKEITSRYMSSSTSSSTPSSSSKRFPSPLPAKSAIVASTTPLRRAQSVERSRPATPSRPNNGAAQKMLLSSTRSLSVSFQGESYSLPISKVKPVPSPVLRRPSTPERKKVTPKLDGDKNGGRGGDQGEIFKQIDQHRWPGRTRQLQSTNVLTRSLDCTIEKNKLEKIGSVSATKALKQSMIDLDRRASLDARLHPKFGGGSEISKTVQFAIVKDSSFGSVGGGDDVVMSDTESVSSGSNSSSQEWGGIPTGRGNPRGISVPARFWQETNSRMRRLQDPGSPLSRSPSSKVTTPPSKFIPLKKTLSDTMSPSKNAPLSRTMLSSPMRGPGRPASPMRGPGRPASPSRVMVPNTSSPSRGSPSPSRIRNAAVGSGNTPSSTTTTPSILSFVADSRGRGKVGENRIVDAHLLRLFYNRHLQWRFVNARADAVLFMKRLTAERNLYNAWITTSELHDSITIKRIKLQLLRQHLKLTSILKGQMTYFKEWALLDRDYSSSLSGTVEAMEAATLRLPVVSGARVDIQNVMDAIGSAVSVMQAMVSSLCSILSKVEEVNSLMAQLANATSEEQDLLVQCRDHLSILSAMQVKDCSLRTHLLQLKRVSTRS